LKIFSSDFDFEVFEKKLNHRIYYIFVNEAENKNKNSGNVIGYWSMNG